MSERKPGPPKSGEVGWYMVRYVTSGCLTDAPGVWTGVRWEIKCLNTYKRMVIPLHDYPLVPGERVREAFEAARQFAATSEGTHSYRYETVEDWLREREADDE